MRIAALALMLAAATLARGDVLRLDWSYTVRNDSAEPTTGTLRALVPVPAHPGQSLVSVDAGGPATAEHDALGNRAVVVSLGVLPPWASRTVRLRALVELVSPSTDAPGGSWLGDEPGIEASSPDIIEAARSLDAPLSASVSRFVASHLKPTGYRRGTQGALWALKNGTGDCTEAACLTVALCRAKGVPARMVSGYLVRGDGALPLQAWHDWAEIHENGTWKRVDNMEGRHVAFLIHGADELLGGARCAAGALRIEAGRNHPSTR
jgi:hypothetical protein